ncbi:MAG: carboxypeptidase regulatory-like domain-containing protein, partial [Chitinophagaceae bacterium]
MKNYALQGLAFLLLQCLALVSEAQTKSTIEGTVGDSTAGKPLQYVTVELHKGTALSAQALKVGFTNDKGKFSFNSIDTGHYTLLLSHTGFAEKQVPLTVTEGGVTALKQLLLSPAPATMKGIVVTARKPLIEQQDDKIIFNVENDPATKTE